MSSTCISLGGSRPRSTLLPRPSSTLAVTGRLPELCCAIPELDPGLVGMSCVPDADAPAAPSFAGHSAS